MYLPIVFSCDIDLSTFEKERTQEIWHDLYDGFGSVRLCITICAVGKLNATTPVYTERSLQNLEENYVSTRCIQDVNLLDTDWLI